MGPSWQYRQMRKLLLGPAVVALAIPTISLAGKKVTAGDQSLQITTKVKPNKAKAGVALTVNADYESLNDNSQVKENTKSVTLKMPRGMKIHPDRYPTCLVSAAIDDPSVCTDDEKVGQGTGTADARPTLPTVVDATITMYNAMDDTNADGSKRDPAIPAVLLIAKVPSLNDYTTFLPFDIHGSSVELDFAPPDPSQPSLFHLQKVNVVFNARGKTSYITAPAVCPKKGKKWPFSLTFTNYDGPSVTAGHKVSCRK